MNMASPALMAEYTGCGGEVHVWVRVGEKLPSYRDIWLPPDRK